MFPTFIHAFSRHFNKAIQIVFEVYTSLGSRLITYKLIACKAFYTVYILYIQGLYIYDLCINIFLIVILIKYIIFNINWLI